ncbi:hypothetical protein C3941_09610 [Kaistia algarum]|uniref:hypothetical protein n=1 Tax=Kaistia algarum TaxID=2083279 RepID=UPI000CE81FAE|nr:hypothetical protein [Kaistia algarum]MCX5512312.1 hypothetical protein [Kaistia algarum]PPE80403.1 hypothetical protein C3941_09610 [Kaistia algarum]
MNTLLKTALFASILAISAGNAHAALSNNGVGLNGANENGSSQNGTQTSGTADRTVVIHTITLSDGTILTVK